MASFLLSYMPSPKTISPIRDHGSGPSTDNHLPQRLYSKINTASAAMKLGRRTTKIAMSPAQNPNIPPDDLFQHIILDGYGYRQRFKVYSYDVPNQIIAVQYIFNLLEETGRKYSLAYWPGHDESGATRGMMKNNLRWVVSRMQFQVDECPCKGDELDIDTWVVGSSRKNGIRRDWEIRWHYTRNVFARATSIWAMVNKETQRVWKMPDEVREEISHSFIKEQAIIQDSPKKLEKLDGNVKYVKLGLQPMRTDLDMNKHVRNSTYVGWMLEAIPDECLKNYQLSNIILEYRRECHMYDVVQSLCKPKVVGNIEEEKIMGMITEDDEGSITYTHLLLQVKEESKCEEVARGETTWKKKLSVPPSSG